MKKLILFLIVLGISVGTSGVTLAQDVQANEKAVHEEFKKLVPKDKIIDTETFKKIHEEILAGNRKAYIIDCRTHPEFYAFHIEGSDHIHAGHMYTIPRKIKDPNTEIYALGIVGWVKAGYPVVNKFAGKFIVTEYHQDFDETGKYRIREFHPY